MTTVTTQYGVVSGVVADGVTRFLGIPYAASPTGPLRFAPPQPPAAWLGVRECTAFGATPPKPDYVTPFDTLLPEPNIAGDEWLNLNVWTPDVAGRAPVMVWIHGGAFSNGNSAVRMYDGHAFARDGVVLVSVNYRLGVDGFALLPDAPPNRGLLDQIAALDWVRDNISAFGGDPANVTIFGESAGAMSVMTLLGLPRASGLFRSAIAQSGAAHIGADPADARKVTGELSKVLGFDATAASLAGLPLDKLTAAQATVRDAMAAAPDPDRWGASVVSTSMAFIPVVDGDVLPVLPQAALAAGHGAEVALLTGTNTEEFRLFFVPNGLAAMVTPESLPFILGGLGIGPDTAAAYQANRPAASPGDVVCALVTDQFFRNPMFAAAEARLAAGGPAPTYVYEFAWRSPVQALGAAHAVEIPFVFDNLTAPDAQLVIGPDPRAELSAEMHATWIRFARTGDPGWQPFDASYPVMTFGATAGPAELVLDPRRDERLSWPSN
ncbi:MAG: carboxylesterase/lipase family protein [Actinobacteria bacterium]|nr:carboxylesterase/lipase family protein [Actinomycetota bacterium]